MPKLKLQLESVCVLSGPELDTVAGGAVNVRGIIAGIKKLFDIKTVPLRKTDGPSESYDLGYRGPWRDPWTWNPAKRYWE